MTTSEQRTELVQRLRDPLADLLTDGARDLRLRAADALEASEAEKQRLVEAVRKLSGIDPCWENEIIGCHWCSNEFNSFEHGRALGTHRGWCAWRQAKELLEAEGGE